MKIFILCIIYVNLITTINQNKIIFHPTFKRVVYPPHKQFRFRFPFGISLSTFFCTDNLFIYLLYSVSWLKHEQTFPGCEHARAIVCPSINKQTSVRTPGTRQLTSQQLTSRFKAGPEVLQTQAEVMTHPPSRRWKGEGSLGGRRWRRSRNMRMFFLKKKNCFNN